MHVTPHLLIDEPRLWSAGTMDHPAYTGARSFEGGSRNRTGVHGFAGRCMTTLPSRRGGDKKDGAGNESRTRDLNLGKVALYQLSYSRVRWMSNYKASPLPPQPRTDACGSALRR